MAGMRVLLGLSIFGAVFSFAGPAVAGGEEGRQEKKKVEQKAPEDTALPRETEAPGMSIGSEEPPSPDYEEVTPSRPSPTRTPRRSYKAHGPDDNILYTEIIDRVVGGSGRDDGVLPMALGFRGYRPNMIALGTGDRVPGFGGLVEYYWNRIGAGIFASRLPAGPEDPQATAYGFLGTYGIYRWLPFDMSPYFLMGVELGSETDETLGGLAGLGVETRVFTGWTLFFGWTFHSTVHRGFLGGGVGWSF